MRLTCPNCGAEYEVPEGLIPPGGKHVQCTACHTRWFMRGTARPDFSEDQILRRLEIRHPRPMLVPTEPPVPSQAPPSAPEPRREAAPGVFAWQSPPGTEPEEAVAGTEGPEPRGESAPAAPVGETENTSAPEEAEAAPMLRPALRTAPRLDLTPEPVVQPVVTRGRGRFLPGLVLALLVAGLAFEIYVWSRPLAVQVPAAAPVLESYAAAVDQARDWLRERIDALRGGEG